MKRKLQIFMACLLFGMMAQAQVIITGVMYDPLGSDAPDLGATNNGYIYKGGYEYVQMMATEDIDFSVTNYALVISKNTTSFGAVDPTLGWAAGDDRTRKFNLTSGTVSRGEFFYVGGPEKTIAGYLTISNVYTPTLDISDRKWIRTIAYSDYGSKTLSDSTRTVFDDFGWPTSGLMPNSASNPIGFAVFKGTDVAPPAVPIDVIFITTANPVTTASVTYAGGGYLVPNSDLYENSAYFASSTKNKFGFTFQNVSPYSNSTDIARFLKLSGVFNTNTKTWDTPRSLNYVKLVPTKDIAGIAATTLSMIEGDDGVQDFVGGVAVTATALYPAPVLPVKLTSFTAKKQQSSVVLNWKTASEESNSHFNVLRSADGHQFENIARINGNGNSHSVSNYTATDFYPLSGNNYYRLTQTDQNGSSSMIGNIVVNYNFKSNSITVTQQDKKLSLNINTQTATDATILISDTQGRKLNEFKTTLEQGNNSVVLKNRLNSGVYVATVLLAKQQLTVKFVIK